MTNKHIPVLLNETIEYLKVFKDGKYIDCTLGAGGHSEKILELGGKILGIEANEQMYKVAEERLKNYCPTLVRANFIKLSEIAKEFGFENPNGILFDLGISSLHYTNLHKGFSFKEKSDALDMRLSDQDIAVTAADLLNVLSETQLTEMLVPVVGRFAKSTAKKIVWHRAQKLFSTVSDLDFLNERQPEVFLALRIAVNSEFDAIEIAINSALNIVSRGGRIVVISFHSLEDKLVNGLFSKAQKEGLGEQLCKKPIEPGAIELSGNPRSRSAQMRVFEKFV